MESPPSGPQPASPCAGACPASSPHQDGAGTAALAFCFAKQPRVLLQCPAWGICPLATGQVKSLRGQLQSALTNGAWRRGGVNSQVSLSGGLTLCQGQSLGSTSSGHILCPSLLGMSTLSGSTLPCPFREPGNNTQSVVVRHSLLTSGAGRGASMHRPRAGLGLSRGSWRSEDSSSTSGTTAHIRGQPERREGPQGVCGGTPCLCQR